MIVSHSIGHVRDALPLSMALQRAIIRQGSSLIDKQAMRTFTGFRLAIIREGPDVPLFCHPATLSRLALWLVEANGTSLVVNSKGKTKRKQLPLVLACLNDRDACYLVAGVNAASETGDIRKKCVVSSQHVLV